MAAEKRIYIVSPKIVDGDFKEVGETDAEAVRRQQRLVWATHPAVALRHVAADMFGVAVASQADLERLFSAGVKAETVKPEPQGDLLG